MVAVIYCVYIYNHIHSMDKYSFLTIISPEHYPINIYLIDIPLNPIISIIYH